MSLGNVGVGFPKIWDFFGETLSKDFQRGSGHHGTEVILVCFNNNVLYIL